MNTTPPSLHDAYSHFSPKEKVKKFFLGHSRGVSSRFLTLSAHAREGYSSHFFCLSVCVSLFHSGEGAVFMVETYISIYILGEDLSPLNVALF